MDPNAKNSNPADMLAQALTNLPDPEPKKPQPKVNDIVVVWDRAWRVKSIKPQEVRLKLLPTKLQAEVIYNMQQARKPKFLIPPPVTSESGDK